MKKILTSKIFRIIFSAILIYFAFRKADLPKLFSNLRNISWQLILSLIILNTFSMLIGGFRWAVLVLGKVTFRDVLIFTKASFTGAFYSLFFPSSVGGDLLKWTTLLRGYPQISKIKLAGTALIDRVIGFSAFAVMAFISLIIGRLLNYQFPQILFWLFLVINIFLVIFYILVFSLDFEKFIALSKGSRFSKFLNKFLEIADLLKSSNKKRIINCFLISIISQPFWTMITWFLFNGLGIDLKAIQVFIFMPIISLILVLPISFAPLGYSAEKLLFASTFSGIIGILMALIGGMLLVI